MTVILIQNAPRGQGGVHFDGGVHYTRMGSNKTSFFSFFHAMLDIPTAITKLVVADAVIVEI